MRPDNVFSVLAEPAPPTWYVDSFRDFGKTEPEPPDPQEEATLRYWASLREQEHRKREREERQVAALETIAQALTERPPLVNGDDNVIEVSPAPPTPAVRGEIQFSELDRARARKVLAARGYVVKGRR